MLYAFCSTIGSSFFQLGKFSSMILLKLFPVSLDSVSFLYSISIIHRLALLIMSQIAQVLCACNLLYLTFFFGRDSLYSSDAQQRTVLRLTPFLAVATSSLPTSAKARGRMFAGERFSKTFSRRCGVKGQHFNQEREPKP